MTDSGPGAISSTREHGVGAGSGTAIASAVLALLGATYRIVGAIVAVGVSVYLGGEEVRAAEAPNRTILLISIPFLLAIGAALLVGGIRLLRKSPVGRTLVVTACSVDIAYEVIEFVIVKAVAGSGPMIAVGSPVLLIIGVIFPVVTIVLTVNSSTSRWLNHGGRRFRRPEFEPVPASPVNPSAVIAVVLGVVIAPLAIPFGHIARSQIKKTGQRGSGMALAGLVLGYLSLLVVLVLIVAGAGALRSEDNALRSDGSTAAGSTSTRTTSAASATAITTWGAREKRTAERFPGLVSSAPNGTGYLDSVCVSGTNSDMGLIQCSADYLRHNVTCLATDAYPYPDYPDSNAGKTDNFRFEKWQRPSGTGHLWAGELDQRGWVYIFFDQMPRAACMVYATWTDHTSADIMAQWWPSAPI